MDLHLKTLIDFGVLELASPLSLNGSDCFFLPHGQVSFIAISKIGREAHRPYSWQLVSVFLHMVEAGDGM